MKRKERVSRGNKNGVGEAIKDDIQRRETRKTEERTGGRNVNNGPEKGKERRREWLVKLINGHDDKDKLRSTSQAIKRESKPTQRGKRAAARHFLYFHLFIYSLIHLSI